MWTHPTLPEKRVELDKHTEMNDGQMSPHLEQKVALIPSRKKSGVHLSHGSESAGQPETQPYTVGELQVYSFSSVIVLRVVDVGFEASVR